MVNNDKQWSTWRTSSTFEELHQPKWSLRASDAYWRRNHWGRGVSPMGWTLELRGVGFHAAATERAVLGATGPGSTTHQAVPKGPNGTGWGPMSTLITWDHLRSLAKVWRISKDWHSYEVGDPPLVRSDPMDLQDDVCTSQAMRG